MYRSKFKWIHAVTGHCIAGEPYCLRLISMQGDVFSD